VDMHVDFVDFGTGPGPNLHAPDHCPTFLEELGNDQNCEKVASWQR